MSPLRFHTVAALGAAFTLLACGGSPSAKAPDRLASARLPDQALRLPVELVKARGVVRVKLGKTGDWQPLAAGMAVQDVREIEVTRHGAVVSIGHGDAAGRLWLRAGARVRLAQDDHHVYVAAVAGRSRLRRSAGAMPVTIATRDGALPITGDVLLQPRRDGTTEVLATGARPQLADWSLALELDDDGAGIGNMETRADDDTRTALQLRQVDVRVKTAGDQAMTEVEHVFFNRADARLEGTFRFPVPDGAVLTGMAMEINGKMMEGEIVEREKARETYEKIVDEMQDPALLEWEQGNWFKLRVFPIEPTSEKRVVIRYTTPLAPTSDGWAYDFAVGVPEAGAGAQTIGMLTVTVDGKLAASERDVAGGLDLSVPVATSLPAVTREVRADGTYTSVRVMADPSLFAGADVVAPASRRVAVIFDTSRSTLESRALGLQLLRASLGALGEQDTFVVLASDVAVTAHAADLVAVDAASIAAAAAFIEGIEPDGASDVAAALKAAAALSPTDVLYIGDGVPTWGELGKAPLATLAASSGAPIHAALVGKGASTELWSELAGASGGRAMIARRAIDVARFALIAGHAGEARRVRNARIAIAAGGAGGGTLYPGGATTLWDGDALVATVHTPAGEPVPAALTLTGDVDGRTVTQQITLAGAVETAAVAQRWAVHHLASLEQNGAPREDIVEASRDHGVLSRYTSLLVLENDEAYKQHEIERRRSEELLAQAAAPTVTGGDLDSLGARRASLSPDEIQPGDPEIKIPAPIDARSVLVTFPWGETKVAVWDRDLDAWMVRFLIDLETPDGEYQARVAVTHADGRVEVLHLGYTVDTTAPAVKLTAVRTATGYKITARQIAANGSSRKDVDRVEVVLPDSQILLLTQKTWGRFEGEWTTATVDAAVTLRVVVRDHALNHAVQELVVPMSERSERLSSDRRSDEPSSVRTTDRQAAPQAVP